MRLKYGIWIILPLILVSCLSYYQRHIKFNQEFESGNIKDAKAVLAKDKKAPHKTTELLYYLKNGHVDFLLNNYESSNDFFEKAFLYTEDYKDTYFAKGLTFLINPRVEPYKGEIHEVLLINYYKALNYLKMGQYEKALVECKRMNIKLHYFGDKYTNENKYQEDAFIHVMMGLIYDANQEFNDAFIAYRNALKIYQNHYQKMFSFGAPRQLKKDILRTAYLTGLHRELRNFEKEFDMNYQPQRQKGGDLVFIWHNGMGPVKEQRSINFFLVRGQGGTLYFKNEKYGLSFPFHVPDEEYESKGLADIEFVRVAFPKYVERPRIFQNGHIKIDEESYELEKGAAGRSPGQPRRFRRCPYRTSGYQELANSSL